MSAIRELRASKQTPCRVCGRPNQRCLNYADGGVLCMNHNSPEAKPTDCGALGEGYYYPPSTPHNHYIMPVVNSPKPSAPAMASPTEKDRVYKALLEAFPLTEQHAEHLTKARRLKSLAGFGSLPCKRDDRLKGCASLHGQLEGIPGLWLDGTAWNCAGPAGILIPYKTPYGIVQGFQVRADDPCKGKYLWLSSAGYPNGTSSGTFCHYTHAAPRLDVWLCEGGLKAEIAAQLTNEAFIGLPGCHLPDVHTLIAPLVVLPRFILCPDADYRTNPLVCKGWVKTVHTLLGHGLECRVATWEPEQGKGIDDVLNNTGQLPTLVSARGWLQSL